MDQKQTMKSCERIFIPPINNPSMLEMDERMDELQLNRGRT